VTATGILQFRCWHDLAQRKRNEASRTNAVILIIHSGYALEKAN